VSVLAPSMRFLSAGLLIAITIAACGAGSPAAPAASAPPSVPPVSLAPGLLSSTPASSPSTLVDAAGPWPEAERDAGHSGTAAVAGPQAGHIRWQRHLEGVVTPGPIVGPNGVVYAASNGGVLHAIDLATGRDRWSFNGRGSYGSDLSTSAALRSDGLLLWPGPHDTLFGIDAATGSLLWQKTFGGMVLSPALGRDHVYIGTMDGRLQALTVSRDGANLAWSSDLGVHGEQSYGSPAVSSDGTVYETVANRIVAVRDAGDHGSILWHFDIASGTEVSPAVSRDGIAIFGTNDQTEYGLDPQGKPTWRYPRNSLTYSSPAVAPDGVAYFGDHRGSVDAIDTRSGTLVRQYHLIGEVWTAPAIDRDGDVYAGTKAGHITGFRADGSQLFDIQTGDVVDSYPAIAGDGTLLIGSSNGELYAIR
jgi:outer membrane protein assembly factor BamB